MVDEKRHEVDETEQIIDEFKLRIGQIIGQQRNTLKELAEAESASIIANARNEVSGITAKAHEEASGIAASARQEAAGIVTKAQEEGKGIIAQSYQTGETVIADARKSAEEKVALIIEQANRKAEKIALQAEGKAKEDAKQKIKREVERIIQTTQEESAKLLARSRKEAEQASVTILEDARERAKKESDRLIAEARKQTEQIAAEVLERTVREQEQLMARFVSEATQRFSQEVGQLFAEATLKTKGIIIESMKAVQGKLVDPAKIMAETNVKLAQAAQADSQKLPAPEGRGSVVSAPEKPVREAIVESTPRIEPDLTARLFQGEVELNIVSSSDYARILRIKRYVAHIPGVRLTGEYGSSDGDTTLTVKVIEPMPLLRMLKEAPEVETALLIRKNIRLELKAVESDALELNPAPKPA